MKKNVICVISSVVNYAYAFSQGYSLPTYDTTWTTPLAIYNYFPVDSDLLMQEHLINQPSLAPTDMNVSKSSKRLASLFFLCFYRN